MQQRSARRRHGARGLTRRGTSRSRAALALARRPGRGGASHQLNSMWDAWKTGYRGPVDGSDAISKSPSARAAAPAETRRSDRRNAANVRTHTARMCLAVTDSRMAAAPACMQPIGMMRVVDIGIALFPDAEELDFAGPWEVLGFWARSWPDDDARCRRGDRPRTRCAARKGCASSPIEPRRRPASRRPRLSGRPWDPLAARCRAIPSTRGCARARSRRNAHDQRLHRVARLRRRRPVARTTGDHALGDRSTRLAGARSRQSRSATDDRFVDTGDVISRRGVSAGIDMALHLVDRLHSTGRAIEVRRGIQYDPEPPV